MDREEIIAASKAYTNYDTDEVTTVCQNHIDLIQDNDICGAYDFSFLTDYAEINTTAVYTTGTASITQDSTTVTGTGTGWTTEMIGRIIKFGSDDEYYEISNIDYNTQTMTLSSAYIGSTDPTATYTMYKIYYELPSDFKKMKWVKQMQTPDVVVSIPEFTMAQSYTNEFNYTGQIQGYILSGLNSSNIPQIRFYPLQTSRKRVYMCYVKKLPSINTEGAESKIPSDKHMLFVYKLNEIIFDMHSMPIRAAKEERKFNQLLALMIREDKQITKDSVDTMQNQFLIKAMAHSVLPPDHYSNV